MQVRWPTSLGGAPVFGVSIYISLYISLYFTGAAPKSVLANPLARASICVERLLILSQTIAKQRGVKDEK
jgi:hypothetical protein